MKPQSDFVAGVVGALLAFIAVLIAVVLCVQADYDAGKVDERTQQERVRACRSITDESVRLTCILGTRHGSSS